jgi:predicted RNA-binding protein with TRAM domain
MKITDTSQQGDGVGKVENFAVFVPNTKIGDFVKVKIIEIKKTCAVGKKLAEL